MPIVFVHGVANRRGSGYERAFSSIERFLKNYVAPSISDDPDGVMVIDAYWGDLGAKFAWGRTSRPRTPLLGMGPEDAPDEIRVQTYAQLYDQLRPIPVAEGSSRETGGLIAAGVAEGKPPLSSLPPDQLSDLAAAIIYSLADDTEDDVEAALIAADELAHNNQFRDELAELEPPEQYDRFASAVERRAEEELGLVGQGIGWLGGLKDRIGEVFDRGRKAPGWAASRVLLEARRPLHDMASVFLGDIFEYLEERGDAGMPGAIEERVVSKLREAHEISQQRAGEPIIVLSHSMGGQIVYDIVTEFLPNATNGDENLFIDFWCAAASQVGFFEELKLFHNSSDQFSEANANLVPFPGSNLGFWWNVWDSSDILSFTAEGIFDGVDDEEYVSGTSIISAHSGYFRRPSFYRALAEKIRDASDGG